MTRFIASRRRLFSFRSRRTLAATFALVALGTLTLAPTVLGAAGTVMGLDGGPAVRYDRVLAYDTDIWTMRFRGGEPAVVHVRGDGDTDLDCHVYDSNGRLVDSDVDLTDFCILEWHPAWSDTYRLEIHNLGYVYNEYRLSTN